MNTKPKIFAIIPARGGSKGLTGKNIKPLNGKPLICHTIGEVLKSKYLDKVFVSTDDPLIANISKRCGAEIIERPEELARDESPTIDAIFHAIDTIKEVSDQDIIILLQATSPLRNVDDINNAFELFLNNECESVVSVCKVEHSPYWFKVIEEGYLKSLFGDEYRGLRRQDLESVYIPNGAIYISIPQTLYKYKSFFCSHTIPYIMPIEKSVDIDNNIDFMLAELRIKNIGLDNISNEALRNFGEKDE